MSPRKSAVFALVAAAVLLAVLELAARLLGYAPPSGTPGYQESKFRASRELIWELAPGWNGEEGGGRIKINSLGFRDNEAASHKPPDEVRVLCLGDSVTFGYLVDQEEPWPRALERTYRERGRQARVLNAGVPGYSTFQEREQLRLKGLPLDPDIVILGYCLNDATERYTTIAEYGGKDVFLGVDTTARLSLAQRMSRRIAIFRFISMQMQGAAKRGEVYGVRQLSVEPLSPELAEAWRRNSAEIVGLADDVKADGKRFLLVIFPYFFQVASDDMDAHQKRIIELCKENKIECLDLLPLFRQNGVPSLYLDDNHLNSRGHRLAAQAVFDVLQ